MRNENSKTKRVISIYIMCIIFLMRAGGFNAFAQEIIKGRITSVSGKQIVGATVLRISKLNAIPKTTSSVISDSNGNYSISASIGDTLEVSYLGYLKEKVVIKNSNTEIVLRGDTRNLEEVVVVGYGVKKKDELTGAVATISGKQLTESPVSNVTNSIGGRVPGVIATTPNGRPGSGSNLNIRGFSSLGNNAPLVIVDGVQRDDGFGAIDPNDIASISILKDAAAAAVYGARANNGVFLITTKRGSLGKPILSYTGNFSIQQPTSYPKSMSASQYARAFNEALINTGVPASDPRYYSDEAIKKYDEGKDGADWYDSTFKKNSPMTNHNLSINGGTDAIRYFASFGYVDQDGMFDNIGYKAYKFRTNIDAKINKTLTLGLGIEGRQENNNNPGYDANVIFEHAAAANPTFIAYWPSGRPNNNGSEHPGEEAKNSGYNNISNNVFQGTLSLNQNLEAILKGLEANGKVSFGKNYSFRKVFLLPYKLYNEDGKGNATGEKINGRLPNLTESFVQNQTIFYNFSLNFQRDFGNHAVNGMLLFEQNESKGNDFSGMKQDFPTTVKDELFVSGPANQSVTGKSTIFDARRALVGRFGYTYNSKYIFETSFRYDGSYIFPKGKQFGFFPAVSGAWRISEEGFMKGNKSFEFVNNLKLRASIGTVGNDRVAAYQFEDAYTIATSGNVPIFNNEPHPLAYYGVYPNSAITWEKSKNTNLGIDGTLWDGLLSFEFDYFIKDTRNILYKKDRSVPATFGRSLPNENYARVKNRGFEFTLGHENRFKDFSYGFKANGSYAVNKVMVIDDPLGAPDFAKQLGKPMGYIAGYESLGIFQTDVEAKAWMNGKEFGTDAKAGDIKYADLNGDGVIDNKDQKVLSDYGSTPRIMYGFSGNLGWKAFDMSFLIQGAAQQRILLTNNARIPFASGGRNSFEYLLDAWSPNNMNAQYPILLISPRIINDQVSNVWLKNSAYARLKSLNIGYTFESSKLEKINLKEIRLFVSGTNLFTISPLNKTGFDPEASSGRGSYYPQQKVFSLGVNVKF